MSSAKPFSTTRVALATVCATRAVIVSGVLALLAATIAALLEWRAAIVLGPLAGELVRIAWRAVGRPPAAAAAPRATAVPEASGAWLRRIAEQEAQALGVPAPKELRLTLERGVAKRGGVLAVGAFALDELPPEQLRVAIAAALLDDADPAVRALRRRRAGQLARALDVATGHRIGAAPWAWYAHFAERLAASALRRHALDMDEALAARHGGALAAAHARGVVRQLQFDHYWDGHVLPVLEAGYRPPLLEGWRATLAAPDEAEAFAAAVLRIAGENAPLESDAGLGDRLAAIGAADRGAAPVVTEAPPECDLAALEPALLGRADRLVPLEWDRAGVAAALPAARAAVPAGALGGWTVAELPELAARGDLSPGRLGAALLTALADAGWEIAAVPGAPVQATCEEATVEPYGLAWALAASARQSADWKAFATSLGIADATLRPAPRAPDALEALINGGPAARGAAFVAALTVQPSFAARTWALLGAGTLLGLPLAAVLALRSFALDLPPGGRAFTLAMAAALVAALALWGADRIRLLRSRGRLVLDEQGLRIEHPRLLRRPFELPRDLVRSAVLDRGGERRDERGRKVGIPIAASQWAGADERGWLWTKGELGVVPVLGPEPCRPNLAIVFAEPVAAPHVRRERARGPLRREAIGGLLLAVDAAPGAEWALPALGFRPELGVEESRLLWAAHSGESAVT